MQDRVVRRYSQAFKRQVVEELESGRFPSVGAANVHFGIGGSTTIRKWVSRLGKNHLLARVVRVEKTDEVNDLLQLRRQVAQLHKALGQTQAENLLNAEYLKLACAQMGEDVEAFKKKVRWEAVHRAVGQAGLNAGVGSLCLAAGMTRQNYYKQRSLRERERIDESLILELVRRERCHHPRMGVRKLHLLLSVEMRLAGIELGRDRLFMLLSGHNLLIQRKRHGVRTTQSWHGFGVYPNLARDLVLEGSHQLLVSDITYIRSLEGFMFLSLVMDAFSRTIVGYDSSDSLEMEGALRALLMAQGQLPPGSRPMHHSDRGSQYCCSAYIAQLRKREMPISMTEENHCYENARAERLNGILKQEYGLGDTFRRKTDVSLAVKEAVNLYNHWRPHGALRNRTPMDVHKAAGV